jgi:predicted nucleic acid-binding protein
MENRRILADTSVIIEFLRKDKKDKSWLWKIKETSVCFMSSITLFELLSGAKTDKHFEDIDKITKWIETIDFDDEIAMVAASMFRNLKRNNQIIDYRDIFIAATAKVHHLTLATLNINHFDRIEGLTLLNIS